MVRHTYVYTYMTQIYDIYTGEKNCIRNNEVFSNYYIHIIPLIMQLKEGHMGWLMLNIYSNLYMSTREKG